jgi:ComF family protein
MTSALSVARRLGQVALDLVFPPRCVACGLGGTFLCDACARSMPAAAAPRCPCCWRPGVAGRCLLCQVEPPAFDGLRASFVYDATARELVHALKYQGVSALAPPMASFMAQTAQREALAADIVVPVPLSGMRQRTRGYNQAEALARELGRELGLPVRPSALRRRRHTPPQVRSRDAGERRRNVAGAFQGEGNEVAGRAVLLVDDVTTTGATLSACAGARRQAGAGAVWALAFARED